MELAHQLCRSHGPYAKSQLTRSLGTARVTLYFNGKQAGKDKAVATAIEQWHERDDTMGHRKLVVLLKAGKNRVKWVMKKYGRSSQKETLYLSQQSQQYCPKPTT